VWLAPVQAIILSITDSHISYGESLFETLFEADIRVEKDFRNEKLGFKIREAQMKKIPYMLIIGNKETETGTVSIRLRDGKNLPPMQPKEIIDNIINEVKHRR